MNATQPPYPGEANRWPPAGTQPQPPAHYGYPAPYGPAMQQSVTLAGFSQPKRCRHGLHFVLTILTAGLWLPIWIIDAIVKGK